LFSGHSTRFAVEAILCFAKEVSLTDSGHLDTAQNDFLSLVIILFADSYTYDAKKGVTHEKI
jgi:hypothetical protein